MSSFSLRDLVCLFFTITLLACLLMPVLDQSRADSQATSSSLNSSSLNLAALTYATDNRGMLPESHHPSFNGVDTLVDGIGQAERTIPEDGDWDTVYKGSLASYLGEVDDRNLNELEAGVDYIDTPIADSNNYRMMKRVLTCPKVLGTSAHYPEGYEAFFPSYGINAYITSSHQWDEQFKRNSVSDFENPSVMILVIDKPMPEESVDGKGSTIWSPYGAATHTDYLDVAGSAELPRHDGHMTVNFVDGSQSQVSTAELKQGHFTVTDGDITARWHPIYE